MDKAFWLERWRTGRIGWHLEHPNPWLIRYWPTLELTAGSPVFVPLCGKSVDLLWLREAGHRVIGVELSEPAVRAFFRESGRAVRVVPDDVGILRRFSGGAIHLYCGDYLDISAAHLEGAVAVWDRGALIALPSEQRLVYADHLQRILPPGTHSLLVTLEYDQQQAPGPPFAVAESEVTRLYEARSRVKRLDTRVATDLPPHFIEQGVREAVEAVYQITKAD